MLQADLQPLHYAVCAARVEVIRYLVHTLNVPITVTAEVNPFCITMRTCSYYSIYVLLLCAYVHVAILYAVKL